MSVGLIAEFTALPGAGDEVERLIAGLAADVHREPGCLDFTPLRVVAPPVGVDVEAGPAPVGDRFIVTERYADEAAFRAHLAAPYGAVFNAALVPLIVEPSSVLTFVRPVE